MSEIKTSQFTEVAALAATDKVLVLAEVSPGVFKNRLIAKENLAFADLDEGGKILTEQLPDTILGAVSYQGTWNAATNTPAIPAAASSNKGYYYVASSAVAASHGYSNVPAVDFQVGDWIISNGAAWEKVDNTEPSASETVPGLIEIATQAEVNAGSDDIRAVTSLKLTTLLTTQGGVPGASAIVGGAEWKNLLLNPNPGDIMRRQDPAVLTSFSNDTYAADRWNILTQSGSIQSQRITGGNQKNAWRLKQNQASAQRFGAEQIFENINCQHLRGKALTFSGRVNISNSQELRVAILEWTGTADAVTSNVVSDWTSGIYTAGNFFLASDVTVAAVDSFTPSAATWTSFSITATLGASLNNLIVLVWTTGIAAQNFTSDFEELQVERGSIATAFERRPFGIEEVLTARYCVKSYDLDAAPGTDTSSSGSQQYFGGTARASSSTSTDEVKIFFSTRMRAAPAITVYPLDGAPSGSIQRTTVTPGSNEAVATVQGGGTSHFGVYIGSTSGLTTGDAVLLYFQFIAEAEL